MGCAGSLRPTVFDWHPTSGNSLSSVSSDPPLLPYETLHPRLTSARPLAMGFLQRPVPPPDGKVNLHGRCCVVTGATAGIGLQTATQLVQGGISTLVLAVRSLDKGKPCAATLAKTARASGHDPQIHVLKLDMASYDGVSAFAAECKQKGIVPDLLVLNAGIGVMKHTLSPSGHEVSLQVNYLSNVLLLLELLPLLESAAAVRGSPSRVTWLGSQISYTSTLPNTAKLTKGSGIFAYLDEAANFSSLGRYKDVKLLCAMVMYEMAKRLDPNKVQLNMVCPGMVKTSMSDVLPWYLQLPVKVVQSIRARTPEQAGWLVLHALVGSAPDTHGKFLADRQVRG